LLITLLTSVPRRDEQQQLVSEMVRVLRPGGHLYVSDLPLQWDPRNIARYADGAARFGEDGVFATSQGCVVRHHALDDLVSLLKDFTIVLAETFSVVTMDGHSATAFRVLAKLRECERVPGGSSRGSSA